MACKSPSLPLPLVASNGKLCNNPTSLLREGARETRILNCRMNLKMGSLFWLMGLCFWVFVFSYSFSTVNADTAGGGANVESTVFIDGKAHIGKIDNDFVCATLDWWPPEKCDYGTCSWGDASLLNLVSFPQIHFKCDLTLQ